MQFQQGQVYKFQYAGQIFQDGTNYFLLTYEGKSSMPEYEDEKWQFRVDCLEFQQNLQLTVGSDIACFVLGFRRKHDGELTTFPILKQDILTILQKEFTIGKSYPFTVNSLPGELDEEQKTVDYYTVHDHLGFTHHLRTVATYKIGETVELTVDKYGPKWLQFADPVRQKIKELFKIGNEYYKPNQVEFERLQTLPDGYTSVLPIKKAVFGIGNGWTVDVIVHIFKSLQSIC
jgi:hypothetical protein